MQKVSALSIDHHLLEKIKEMTGSYAVLHSHFDHAINFLYEDEMLTIVSESIDNAVSTMRISEEAFNNFFLKPAQKIFFTEKGIQVNEDWMIDWKEAEIWIGKRIEFPISSSLLVNNLSFAKEMLKEQNKPTWAHPKVENKWRENNNFEQMMESLLYEETEKVFEAIANLPIKAKQLNETKLFGLGKGLTPSGDDILTGICFVSATQNYPIDLSVQREKWKEIAKNKTNPISATAIYHASQGSGRESMHDFLEALLFSKKPKVVLKKLEKVLAIGSSSGSEIAWGMIRTVEVANRTTEKY